MKKPKLLVVGSMNMDLFIQGADRLPELGESVLCGEYGYTAGGKGSNQALAAALLGAEVVMVGRVGKDPNGDRLIQELEKGTVRTDGIVQDEQEQTGLAVMLLQQDGRYVSYVALGANRKLCREDVKKVLEREMFDMILMQLEMPIQTVYDTYVLAKEKKIPVFLDAGPAMQLDLSPLQGIYILSPNESETKALTGIYPGTQEETERAARQLYRMAEPKYVVLKLGERGAFVYDGKKGTFFPGFQVEAVDSTAAGDTFGAALSIGLCRKQGLEEAIRFAHAAAGICVSRMGAQTAIPTEEEVTAFLEKEETGERK